MKSGTDFRQFSTITVDFSQENLQVEIESVDVTSDFEPDNELSSLLEQFTGTIEIVFKYDLLQENYLILTYYY